MMKDYALQAAHRRVFSKILSQVKLVCPCDSPHTCSNGANAGGQLVCVLYYKLLLHNNTVSPQGFLAVLYHTMPDHDGRDCLTMHNVV